MAEMGFVRLEEKIKDSVVDLYVRVFGGDPWYEVYKCKSCGVAYGEPTDDLEKLAREKKCVKNQECSAPLELVSFYNGDDKLGESIFMDALAKDGFVGFAGVIDDVLVGFSWGYPLQEQDTPSVKFSEIKGEFAKLGIDPSKVFWVFLRQLRR